MNNATVTDETLWQAVREGSETAFEGLYRRYFQVLFSYGKRIHQDGDAVNDAIQDLFVDIWRSRRSLSQAQSVRFYLIRSLRRKIHRSLKPDSLHGEEWENVQEAVLPTEESPESLFTHAEDTLIQSEKLTAWLSQLPPRQNEALLLRYYHNFEYSEIADILHIKEQTARNLVQKALQLLRKMAILLIATALQFIF
ncbi:RNA polymerase sigma factor [Runella slithyformis]|uniref:RNA polymerase, sigma-24 subunit, ECF subfamily n=1 Tax=Runella slithyformis (strain ATCC 29530 / DSM 19594 / LMG 11500 / NCIMB 11436 / LSU 4) TaxID=761193 RepID=A0A7U4E6K6_RUNSL|nr:sigma-70 family RNA polymerase sigma factor [Runella slithyformis]AEI49691.1 RNA polymerase, sigma-24 subunit, ECF subfamily [Runella slithyformis DSM 19594]